MHPTDCNFVVVFAFVPVFLGQGNENQVRRAKINIRKYQDVFLGNVKPIC